MSMALQNIPQERFQTFHQHFNGEGNGIWNVCAQCGGRCELHKIGTLMPGEKEFIASHLGLPVEDFTAKYLDGVSTPRGHVDVLKLKPGCPFLDSSYHCVLADKKVKPVLCEIYPVVFDVNIIGGTEKQPELAVEFLVDELDCPLMHASYQWHGRSIHNLHWREHRHYFETRGAELIREVNAPAPWYWIVAQYDNENFDYKALERLRQVPVDQYQTFTLDELMTCSIGHDL